MNVIGTFTKQNDGFVGTVRTHTVDLSVRFVPNDKTSDRAPDFRALTDDNYSIGAAWSKESATSGRSYLSVTLDDPSFPATINARLVEGENGDYDLMWKRNNKRRS